MRLLLSLVFIALASPAFADGGWWGADQPDAGRWVCTSSNGLGQVFTAIGDDEHTAARDAQYACVSGSEIHDCIPGYCRHQ